MGCLDQFRFVFGLGWYWFPCLLGAESHYRSDDGKQEQNYDDNFAHSECEFPSFWFLDVDYTANPIIALASSSRLTKKDARFLCRTAIYRLE